MQPKPHPVLPSLREAEISGDSAEADVEQHKLGELRYGSSLTDVPLASVPLPDGPLSVPCPDGSVGEESTSPGVAEDAMVVGFQLGSGSCLVLFLGSNLLN
jgi:hypothetical protein